jgi:predicted RNA binding protein YcfA (HicA-like mRNA interferase family)
MVKALQNARFEVTHVRGSHHYLRLPGSIRLVVVPVHGNRDLPTGTLRTILRQAGLTADELVELL